MNWEALGAIGEIIGAVAVVATLAYLAVQIRQNTKVARSAARQAIAQMAMDSASDLRSDGELAELLIQDLEGKGLHPAQRLRLLARSYVAFRHWENVHYQYLSGMLSEDEWRGFRLNLKALLEWGTNKDYWSNEGSFFSSAFQSEVALILKELEASSEEMSHRYIVGNQEQNDA